MAHLIIGGIIFAACVWAVFSPRVRDGFIGRHLLTFAAISALGFAYSGELRAFFTMYILILSFAVLFYVREFKKIAHAKLD